MAATGLAAKLDRATRTGRFPVLEQSAAILASASVNVQSFPITPPLSVEDETWDATLPPSDPSDEVAALATSLSAVAVEDEDLDLLWDCVRADADRGKPFLGIVPTTSTEMRAACRAFVDHFYILVDDRPDGAKVKVGFAAFEVVRGNRMLCHLYLCAEYRGDAPRLLPQLMHMAETQYPQQTFVVLTEDMATARMLRGVGFTAAFLLRWEPRVKFTPPESVRPDEALENPQDY